MKPIFQLQLSLLVIIVWALGTYVPLVTAIIDGNHLAGLCGAVFFFTFIYPAVWLLKKIETI